MCSSVSGCNLCTAAGGSGTQRGKQQAHRKLPQGGPQGCCSYEVAPHSKYQHDSFQSLLVLSALHCGRLRSGSAIQVMLCPERAAKNHDCSMRYRLALIRQHYLDTTTPAMLSASITACSISTHTYLAALLRSSPSVGVQGSARYALVLF
jgi:hypothetical protein